MGAPSDHDFYISKDEILPQICIFVEIHHIFNFSAHYYNIIYQVEDKLHT